MPVRLLAGMTVVLAAAGGASARDAKLVNADGVDASSVATVVATVTQGCATDQEKMVALWSYITHRPFYHWCEAREDPEGATELGVVYDPVIAFNVYGTVICYQVSDLLANLTQAAGIQARTLGLPGHKVMEAFYDGQWHLFDATYDCQGYFVADDGKTILDLEGLCRDAGKYLRDPKFPSTPFYQFDRLGGKFWPWESKEYVIKNWFAPDVPGKVNVFAPYVVRGHAMHLDLRRGEKLIRHFGNEGKWFCSPALYAQWKKDQTQRWVDQGPHDPRIPGNTYANGLLIYEPDWTVQTNFRDGLYEGKDFVLEDGKVHPLPGATANLVFRVQTPYLIAGKPGKLDQAGDSSDGAIFQAEFFRGDESAANTVAVSTDNGLSWREAWKNDKSGLTPVRLDLTNHVEGTYGYLLKVTLSGRDSADAAVGKMRMETSLFYTPVSLPAVAPGENRFTFSVAEDRGVLCIRPDLGEAKGWQRFFREVKDLKYDPNFVRHLAPTGREGHAVIEVAGPEGSKVESLAVHGSFGVATGSGNAESVEAFLATNPGGPWKPAWKSDFSARNDKWRWDDSFDVRLEQPAGKCYLKFLLRQSRWMSLNGVRVYATCVRPAAPLKPGAVRITHAWEADGKPGTHAFAPDPAGQTYGFRIEGKEVRNRSVTIEVANDR